MIWTGDNFIVFKTEWGTHWRLVGNDMIGKFETEFNDWSIK